MIVAGAPLAAAHAEEIADELNVKSVEFGDVEASELRVKPNLPVLGPKLGKELPEVRAALAEGRFTELDGGRFQVDGYVLEPDEVLVERIGARGLGRRRPTGGSPSASTRRSNDELLLEARVERPDPRGPGAAQGVGPRGHRPDPALDPGRGPAAVLGPHRRRDARGLGRARARAPAREGLSRRLDGGS